MKIAIDARELRTSTGRYVERLLHYLQSIDTEHDYVVLLKPNDVAGWQPTNPRFTVVICPFKPFTFGEQLGFLRQVRSLKADLVHFPMVQQPVLYRGKVVTTMNDLTTARFPNPTKHPIVFGVKQRVYRWVNKRVARKSAAVLTYSDFVRRDVIEFTGAQPDKFTVTPLAADPLHDDAEPYEPLVGKRFLMYIGRPMPHKNLGRIIDAFAKLRGTYPDLHLVLAGKKDGNYAIHEKNVIAKGIQNVVFTDYIEDSQVRWLYENCAAYVFPSLSEGFGLPGLEAMLHGAPVVSSNATCLPEVYGDAAHYFDPTSVDDMAAKIDDVLTDETLRNDLIAKGHARVAEFSWDRMAQQTLAVYNKALQA